MSDLRPTLYPQLFGCLIETCDRDRVSEYVVQPAYFARFRFDKQLGTDKMLIVAFARAQHQPMLAEARLLIVAISCHMRKVDERHQRFTQRT